VWLATSAGVFEIDEGLTAWVERLRARSDTTGFSDVSHSANWLWALDYRNQLYAAPLHDAREFVIQQPLGGGRTLEFASPSGDTVSIHSTSHSAGGKTAVLRFVRRGGMIQQLDSLPLQENGFGRIAFPGGYRWTRDESAVFYLDSAGQRHRVLSLRDRVDASGASFKRASVLTDEGLITVDRFGNVISRVYEAISNVCAVERHGRGWRAYLDNGTVLRADTAFLWEWPEPPAYFDLTSCAVGSSIWAIGNSGERFGIFRASSEGWMLSKDLGEKSTGPYGWIHAAGDHVWAASGDISGDVRLLHSRDGGRGWDTIGVNDIVAGSLATSGRLVWAINGESDSTRHLLVLAGRRARRTLPVAAGSVHAWVAGDSVWVVDGSKTIHFTPDWGKTWRMRLVSIDGASLVGIRKSAAFLSVRDISEDGEAWYSSVDDGFNWTPALSSAPPIPGTETLGSPWQNSGGRTYTLVRRTVFPRISSYRIDHSLTHASLELLLDTTVVDGVAPDSFTLKLAGVDSHDHTRGEYEEFADDACRREQRARWVCSFAPQSAGIRPGEKGYLLLTVEGGDFRHAYALPAFEFLPVWRRLPAPVLWAAAGYATVLLLSALLLVARPLWLHWIYWTLHRYAASLPWLGGTWAVTTLRLLLPHFAHHPRVLDAWVEKHAEVVEREFKALDARLIPPEQYVPLPLDVRRTEAGLGPGLVPIRTIGEPTAESFRPFFRADRTLLEIVGTGGSGKTTLALRVIGWALGRTNEERLTSHRMLPVWVDEETDDLLKVAGRQLRAWTGEDLSDEFVRRLLAAGRTLVVLDRLSERSVKMQEFVRRSHGQLRVRRMLVTSRTPIEFESRVTTYLGTRELTFDSLARLITARLAVADADPGLTASGLARPHLWWTAEKQAELTTRITRLFRVAKDVDEGDIPLQPLLVRIAVDEAAALRKAGSPASKLAASIPRLIENYLKSLNPSDAGQDCLTHDAMLRAAQLAAALELGTQYRPRSFSRTEAEDYFAANKWDITISPDPLRRLIANGVLVDEGAGYMRFRLDPVAEYVAAEAAVQKHGQNAEAWQSLLSAVAAAGADSYGRILVALRQIRMRAL
jgi:hypothetical protein